MTATIKPIIVTVIAVTILILTIPSQQQQRVVFAMHDSTLGVNTWIASDNSTQLNTIDLNKDSVSSTSTTEGVGETTEEEDEITEEEVDVEEDEGEDEEPSSDEGEEGEEDDEQD